jgi:hypothetical protein
MQGVTGGVARTGSLVGIAVRHQACGEMQPLEPIEGRRIGSCSGV